jgi:hypothetical protein
MRSGPQHLFAWRKAARRCAIYVFVWDGTGLVLVAKRLERSTRPVRHP